MISAKTAFVFGPMARRKFSGSDGSTNLVVMPSFGSDVLEQVVRAAVQAVGRHDLVARSGDGEDGVADGRLPRRQRQRADAALQRRDALLEHVGGRVHDAGVDVAELLQREQVGGMIRIVEDVRRRLVDRHRPGPRGRIGLLTGVHRQRFQPVLRLGFALRSPLMVTSHVFGVRRRRSMYCAAGRLCDDSVRFATGMGA